MTRFLFIACMILTYISGNTQVGINTANPHTSAALDVTSTTKGFLPPRMTRVQRDAIGSPAEGLIISCTDCTVEGLHQYINGSWQSYVLSSTGNYGTVVNPVTGKVWLDRNLGATQVATSSTDAASYGDMYQWGRGADGHEKRSSAITSETATHWFSGEGTWNGLFIISFDFPFTWLNPNVDDLWTGSSSENNPCPSGFRIPTSAEWNQERLTWATNDAFGAFASPLKLPLGGNRYSNNGDIFSGSFGSYWTSTVNNDLAKCISFSLNSCFITNLWRGEGLSIRCIKD